MGAGARRPQPTSLGGGQGAYGRQSSRFRGRRYSFGGGPHPPGMGSAVPRPPGAAFGVTVGGHKGQDVSKGRGRATTRVPAPLFPSPAPTIRRRGPSGPCVVGAQSQSSFSTTFFIKRFTKRLLNAACATLTKAR